MRLELAEVSSFSFFFSSFILFDAESSFHRHGSSHFFFKGMATMNKNKEKEIADGEDITLPKETNPVETRPARTGLKPLLPSSSGKRKVDKVIDKSTLPSHRNLKK